MLPLCIADAGKQLLEVDGLIERVTEELGGEARVIATGGQARSVVKHCTLIERYEPILTLIGLRLIFERNPARDDH